MQPLHGVGVGVSACAVVALGPNRVKKKQPTAARIQRALFLKKLWRVVPSECSSWVFGAEFCLVFIV